MPNTTTRSLKIEAIGDFARARIKPRIRLSGCWLERAGFKPGQRVSVHLLRPGELTLLVKEAAVATGPGSAPGSSPFETTPPPDLATP